MKRIKDWIKNKRQIRIFASLGVLSISLGIVIVGVNVVYYINNPQYAADPLVYSLVMKELCVSSFLLVFGIIFVLADRLSKHSEGKGEEKRWWNKKIPPKTAIVILIILGILIFLMGRLFVKEYTGVWDDLMSHIGRNR